MTTEPEFYDLARTCVICKQAYTRADHPTTHRS